MHWKGCRWPENSPVSGGIELSDLYTTFVNDTLPIPSPIFPVPFYPDDLVIPPSYSPFVGPPPSNPLAIFANTIFDYMCR